MERTMREKIIYIIVCFGLEVGSLVWTFSFSMAHGVHMAHDKWSLWATKCIRETVCGAFVRASCLP